MSAARIEPTKLLIHILMPEPLLRPFTRSSQEHAKLLTFTNHLHHFKPKY